MWHCLADVAENARAGHVITDLVQPQHKRIAQVMDEHVTTVLFYLHKQLPREQ